MQPARAPTLSIFFPMWNEQDYIDATLDAATEVCDALVASGEIGDFELLVIDDASTDGTGARADARAAADSRIRVIHHPVNRKLGGALKTGFANARGDLILYTDADLPFDLADVGKACRLLRLYNADVVSAYRLDRTAEGPRRAVYSFGYNALVRIVFGIHLRDVNFSFKLCRRGIFAHVPLVSEGSFIDVELLVRAQRRGFRVIQFGVDYFARTRGVSTLSSFPVILKILRELFTLSRELAAVTALPPEVVARARHPDGATIEPIRATATG